MAKRKPTSVDTLDPKKHIIIKGARVHNLKNVDVALPRKKLIVITGLSGSGKSSLAYDTLFAEGQRRYVESLSSYARQFLGRLDKPDVDYIKGISPAISIEQKVVSRSSRSTVGTTTEVYDYLKLLFARVGKTFSPVSGNEVKRHYAQDVLDALSKCAEGQRAIIYAPLILKNKRTPKKQLETLLLQGFTRVRMNGEVAKIEDVVAKVNAKDELWLVIDRISVRKDDEDNEARIVDSAETAFYEGEGDCFVEIFGDKNEVYKFSNRFELDGLKFEEPSVNFFSFNNPVGACKTCEGFGSVIGIDEDLVVPDKSKSVYDDAVACWRGEKMSEYKKQLLLNADKFGFPIHKPFHELSPKFVKLLWKGNKYFEGLDSFFAHIEEQSYKIQYRVMLSRYRGKTKCPDCMGARLRKDADYVQVGGAGIRELLTGSVDYCSAYFKDIKLDKRESKIAERLLVEITSRLEYLQEVGLGYLTLDRPSATLSGGETQRINLATSLGSSLVGSMYILDEPSIGLHPRDTQRLIGILKSLRDLGNTVIIVEHDEEIMRAADEIVDMGPMAGSLGGEVVFAGDHKQLLLSESITAKYLTGRLEIPVPKKRRTWKDKIELIGCRHNNLKNIDVTIPLRCFTVITGVSGSGKSSLVKNILYPSLKKRFGGYAERTGDVGEVRGDIGTIDSVEFVDQNPIGKSSRSNPVTYVKAYDDIRALFSQEQLSKNRGYKPSHFSFNVSGGRCETCEGEGEVTIAMQFMADIKLECETCNGRRFKDEVLEVKVGNKSISDILGLTVDDAIAFFNSLKSSTVLKKIINKLMPLQEVGLGYVGLGQSSSTLSGGEAQRIKLASFLIKNTPGKHTLYIFDEPTTGLHFHDIQKLLVSFEALLVQGHSILVVEHDPDVIKTADWVVDLGPEGGDKGGHLVFEGTPEKLTKVKKSYTAEYLIPKLQRNVKGKNN